MQKNVLRASVVADVLAVSTAITLLAIVAFPALAGEMSGTQSVPALFGGSRLWAFSSGGTLAMATCEGTRWWLLPTLVLFSAAVRVVVPRMALMNSTALAIPPLALLGQHLVREERNFGARKAAESTSEVGSPSGITSS